MLEELTRPLQDLRDRRRRRRHERQRIERERRRELDQQDPERRIEKLVQSAMIDQKQRPY